ncbi:MAG: hypothetical protein A2W98_14630 [Bacteroidetes bacterium GWF2_33_38]|nr:MAG: hypothetical protein A2W98_14630 [Bacteroidetes bacterium GWF2_33_38]OFY76487.1 MAG: hypothetical protein A2265_08770 [Bacteroidetes bacterium RIFOXYA12_FULL_33_9]HBX52623.1 hypothetical protein [Bacteroidales bacterium]
MKKTYRLLGIVIVLSFLTVGIQSCLKDNFDFNKITTSNLEWNTNLAVPIVYSKITLRDLLQDYDSTEVFEEDSSHFIYIMYEGQVASVEAEDLIKFPTQTYNGVVPNTALIPAGISGWYAELNTVQNFDVSNFERLDSIILKYAKLNIALTSTFKHYGQVFVTFPTVTLNDVPLRITIPINSNDGSFSTVSTTNIDDLEGNYVFDLTNGGTDYNKLPMKLELQLQNSGNPISNGEFISVNAEFSNIQFQAAYGFLGQKSISISTDTVQLEMYNNVFEGESYFADPKINVYIDNSYGIPVQFNLTNLGAYSKIYGGDYAITMPLEYDPLIINAPTIDQVGTFAETDMFIHKDNSNISFVMSYLPKYIFYGVDAQLNPDPSVNNNFVLDTSRFDVNLEVELPLWGHAKYFAIQDTGKFVMADYYDQTEYIDWILFRLNVDNGFPTDMSIQAYFCDSVYNKLDSLFLDETELIQSGVIDSDGRVVEKTYKTTDLLFSHNRIEGLKDCKYMLFKGTVTTTNNATVLVKFYSDYTIDLKFSMQAQIGLPLDSLSNIGSSN